MTTHHTESRMRVPMLISPIAHFQAINLDELNRCLVAWGHVMGPITRPAQYGLWAHGLFHNGELVAVAATATLIRGQTCGITREDAVELARLCAARPGLCRVALRMWREFVFLPMAEQRSWRWAISYQDAVIHTGATYRLDGWMAVGKSDSGTDQRTGRKGRSKVVWGWSPNATLMAQRKAEIEAERKRKAERPAA